MPSSVDQLIGGRSVLSSDIGPLSGDAAITNRVGVAGPVRPLAVGDGGDIGFGSPHFRASCHERMVSRRRAAASKVGLLSENPLPPTSPPSLRPFSDATSGHTDAMDRDSIATEVIANRHAAEPSNRSPLSSHHPHYSHHVHHYSQHQYHQQQKHQHQKHHQQQQHQHRLHMSSSNGVCLGGNGMYRSSSSQELVDRNGCSKNQQHQLPPYQQQEMNGASSAAVTPASYFSKAFSVDTNGLRHFRREFGSHGAINSVGRQVYKMNHKGSHGNSVLPDSRQVFRGVDCSSIISSMPAYAVLKDYRSLDIDCLPPDAEEISYSSLSLSSVVEESLAADANENDQSPPSRAGAINRLQRLWETRDRRSVRKTSASSSAAAASTATNSVPFVSASTSVSHTSTPATDISTTTTTASTSIFRRLRGNTANKARVDADAVDCALTVTKSVSVDASAAPPSSAKRTFSVTGAAVDVEMRRDERRRRRLLVHYDWHSLLASMTAAMLGWRLDQLKRQRQHQHAPAASGEEDGCVAGGEGAPADCDGAHKTATGASAALAATARRPPAGAGAAGGDGGGDGDQSSASNGDQRSNELIESCALFCNELGGEPELCVTLAQHWPAIAPAVDGASAPAPPSPSSVSSAAAAGGSSSCHQLLHRPAATCCLSVLEQPASLTHWPVHHCPFERPPQPALEFSSFGDFYYKDFFYGKPHENWVGVDESVGPLAISVRRDQLTVAVPAAAAGAKSASTSSMPSSSVLLDDDNLPVAVHTCYRVILRCSELRTMRGLILEDALPQLGKSSDKQKRLPVREILDSIAPEIHTNCLYLAKSGRKTEDYLMKLDEQNVCSRYKVGVLYCRAGQCTEDDMYGNETAGPALDEFLEMIGQRVRLRGFDKYKAGLDTKSDSTGLYSVYTQYQGNEIMFHVSTMLQYLPNNRQQLLRKRYIGNDIVTIVFQEPGAGSFSPKHMRSQFQHVFIVVRAINPCSGGDTQYRVAVSRFEGVPSFGPPLSESAVYVKGKALADLICAKVINAENSAYRSAKFVSMARRTRQEYLKDLTANYVTDTCLDQQQKFSLMSFGARKRERPRARFNPDIVQRGAIAWTVMIDDHVTNKQMECVLGVSADAVVLACRQSEDLVFAAPSCSILAWSLQGNNLRVYYHRGECLVLYAHSDWDTEELAEIAARLAAVSRGTETQELLLKRSAMGQLGLHVQQDGVVTEVETHCSGWGQGLRPGARLVEICKVAVCTMTYDQMVDLLKTSPIVSVTLVPPASCSPSPLPSSASSTAPADAAAAAAGCYSLEGRAMLTAAEAAASVRHGCTMAVCGRSSPLSELAQPSPGSWRGGRQMAAPAGSSSGSPSLSSSGYHTTASSSSSSSSGGGAGIGGASASGGGGGGGGVPQVSPQGTLSSTCSSSSGGGGGGGLSAREHGGVSVGGTPPPLPLRFRPEARAARRADAHYDANRVACSTSDGVQTPVVAPPRVASAFVAARTATQPVQFRSHQDISSLYGNYTHVPCRATIWPEQRNLHSLSTYLVDTVSCIDSGASALPPHAPPVPPHATGLLPAPASHYCSVDSLAHAGPAAVPYATERAGVRAAPNYCGASRAADGPCSSTHSSPLPPAPAIYSDRNTISSNNRNNNSSGGSNGGVTRASPRYSADVISATPARRITTKTIAATATAAAAATAAATPVAMTPSPTASLAERRSRYCLRFNSTATAIADTASLQQELRRLIAPDSPPPPPPPHVTSRLTTDNDTDAAATTTTTTAAAATTTQPATVLPSGGGAQPQWLMTSASRDPDRERATDSPDSVSLTSRQLNGVQTSAQCDVSDVSPHVGQLQQQQHVPSTDTCHQQQQQQEAAAAAGAAVGDGAGCDSSSLHERLSCLQQQLACEQNRRHSLENKVFQLSKDNRRLQDESKQAAQQLRKFTEWFFNNFEKS